VEEHQLISDAIRKGLKVQAHNQARAAGTFTVKGDPIKMAEAMIDSVDRSPAPKRLTLGGSTYSSIRGGLSRAARRLDSQRDIALSTDVDA
jgi:hypothetical protein